MLKITEREKRKWQILNCLLDDATQSMRNIARKTGMHRRTAWQIQKDLEKNHMIWGYTAVIDEQKLDHVLYIMQFQTRPFTRKLADLMTTRLMTDVPKKQGIRILDIYYMQGGDYDVLIKFSAPNHETARNYFELFRTAYKDHFLEVPKISIVNVTFVQSGKINPELKKIALALVPNERK